MLELSADNVVVDAEATEAEAVIRLLADLLYEHGAVEKGYGEATVQRERQHPTGLPSKPIPIAFPHAGVEGVIHSTLAVASLRHPVFFKSMEDPDEELPVELVFMLANNSPEEQIDALRGLACVFSDPAKLAAVRSLRSSADIAALLSQELVAVW